MEIDFSKLQSQSEADQVALAKYSLQKIYKQSLFHTASVLLNYSDITHYTHNDIIKCLESDSKRKMIVCPRGTFKSSLAVVSYAIWRIINDPNIRILIESETFVNSQNFIREIKSHLESEQFTQVFGNMVGSRWTDSAITVSTRTKNYKEPTITAGSPSTVRVGQHYTLIISDDLNSTNNSETHEAAEKVYNHFRYNMAILEPEGTYVLVGTRYSANDVIGRVLENECNIHPSAKDL